VARRRREVAPRPPRTEARRQEVARMKSKLPRGRFAR
jgi:hypothetical protein